MKVLTKEALEYRLNRAKHDPIMVGFILALIHECREIDELIVSNKTALDRYNAIGLDITEKETPLERLRFFCSYAMNGQDWLDSETFFNDLDNVDTLTVSKLRPMSDANEYKNDSVLICLKGDSNLHEAHFNVLGRVFVCEQFHSFDECDGFIPMPVYKPEEPTKEIIWPNACG